MTAIEGDSAAKAINDACALLNTLIVSEMVEMHVVSGDIEIYIARQGGGTNPMRVGKATVPAKMAEVPQPTYLTAPHVATLVDVIAAGSKVTQGDWIATLRVIGDTHQISATSSGHVTEVFAMQGDLLEFGMQIASLISDE